MKTVTVVPSVLESKLTGQGVRTETRMSRAELKGLFADGSRWKLVNCLLGPCDRLRIVSRPTSYGFLFMTDDGRESSLRFETGDYIVLGQRDGKPEITIYSKDGRLSAQYIPAEPERIVTLKCEDDSPSYDQRPRRIIVKDETPEKWIGWPEDWRKRGITDLEPIEWPKFAWKQVQDEN